MSKKEQKKIMGNPVRSRVILGFLFVSFLAVAGFAQQMIRGFDGMDSTWSYSTGIEIMGIWICSIILMSCAQNADHPESQTRIFIPPIITCAICLFLDECAWLVQGIPEYRLVNCILNAFLHIAYYTTGLIFWTYIYKTLHYRSRLTKICNWIFLVLYLILCILCILDIFLPIFFTVDSAGMYARASLYRFRPILYLALVPSCIELFIKSDSSIRTKSATGSMVMLPLLAEIVTFLKFGVSMKPAAILLSILINYGLVISTREKRYAVTQNELNIASKIQMNLLPNIFPAYPERKDFDVVAATIPAKEVGGDFYDFFMIDENHIAILIADVSDKGIGAALFMTISKIIVKTRTQLGGTPSEILKYVDDRISEKNDAGMFVTLWLGIIDLKTGHVECGNAGHDYPAIMHDGKFAIEKNIHGSPIGFLPGMAFPSYSFDLKPGDRIFLYTDGIVEAKNPESVRFGTERMLEVLNAHPGASDKELIELVNQAVGDFVKSEPQFDDMTMLSFTYFNK